MTVILKVQPDDEFDENFRRNAKKIMIRTSLGDILSKMTNSCTDDGTSSF